MVCCSVGEELLSLLLEVRVASVAAALDAVRANGYIVLVTVG